MQHRPPLIPYNSFAFAAEPPEFPTRREGDSGRLEYVAKAAVTGETERGITLAGETQNGEPVAASLSIIAPGTVRVLLEGLEGDADRITLAREVADQTVDVLVERSDGSVKLASDDVTVRIELDPFHVTFHGPDGQPFLDQNYDETNVADYTTVLPFGFSTVDGERVAFHDTFTAEPDEHFYGFGEKFDDFDKRGRQLEMWHYDAYGVHTERAYKNVPFFVGSRGYGLFVDSITRVNFDMAGSNNSTFSIVVPDTALDYYVIAGPDPKTIVARYASLVSLPILPPKWAFGLWMSSGFQRDSQEDVMKRARSVREHDVPCDVMHLDCYWQRFGRWSEMLWDEEMFPDPEAMIREVKGMGFRNCLWINPYIGVESERFKEADEKGYFLKNPDGESYVVDLWGRFHPAVGIVDFTNPEATSWFKGLLSPLLRQGVDVFKTDFGEGVPSDAAAHNGMTGEELHNLYPLLYNDAVAEVTAEETGRPGMVWGRCTYAGGQRHAAQWGGDPNCTYGGLASTLRGGLSMAMCGHAFWSHDIGGFHRQPTPDLYVRWAQFGLFSPLSRAHGMTTRLPWDYGEVALRIFRDYTRLRYRFLPYIFTYAAIAAETSLPLMRPMVLEFPDDPNTHDMDLQYMFGSELLVAPIYNSGGQRPVYLPAGRWVDYWTREVIEGPRTLLVEAPLDVIPLYVRANTLIPTIEPQDHLTDEPFDFVIFDAYLLEGGAFELRDSDGTTRISASIRGDRLEVAAEGVKRSVGLHLDPLPSVAQLETVTANGETLELREVSDLTPNSAGGWSRDEDGTIRAVITVRQAL
jgi:alpha-D-xyloside xylohydrolase